LKVVWSTPANRDLIEIEAFVAKDKPLAAVRLALRIYNSAGSLRDMPLKGRPVPDAGTRELVIVGTPYIVVYEIVRNVVRILRIRHAAREWPPRRAR
jgi:addiction module RelE/StbE family toxin